MADFTIRNNDNPTWERSSLAELFDKSTVEAIRSTVEKVRGFLDKIKTLLSAIRGFIAIIRRFESLINDLFFNLIIATLREFQRVVDEAKSTGVYFLDLVSPLFIEGQSYIDPCANNKLNKLGDDASWEAITDQALEKASNTTASFTEKYVDRFTNPAQLLSRSVNTYEGKNGKNALKSGMFRTLTYEEWIAMAADAFLDKYDVADPLFNVIGDNPDTLDAINKNLESVSDATGVESVVESAFAVTKAMRPGRPNFGPNGAITGYVIAFATPNFAEFVQNLFTVVRVFNKTFEISNILEGIYSLFKSDTYEDIPEEFKKVISEIGNTLGQSASDLWDGQKTAFKGRAAKNRTRGDVDFYGNSMYQLFPQLFDSLNELINWLESEFEKIEDNLTSLIEKEIARLEKKIRDIIRLLNLVERLIGFLEQFLALGVYTLKFSTTNGSVGAALQLRGARGFPLAGTGLPMYIGGYLVCFGYPQDEDYKNMPTVSRVYNENKARLSQNYGDAISAFNSQGSAVSKIFKSL